MSAEFSFPEGEAHKLANDYVQKVEDADLSDLYNKTLRYTKGSFYDTKARDEFHDEMDRLYVKDEDHEVERDLKGKIDNWLNGNNIEDNDRPDDDYGSGTFF